MNRSTNDYLCRRALKSAISNWRTRHMYPSSRVATWFYLGKAQAFALQSDVHWELAEHVDRVSHIIGRQNRKDHA